MSEKRFEIQKDDEHNRLDKFTKKMLPNSTLSLIYSSIRKWKIKINNSKAKISDSVKEWDIISFYFNDDFFNKLRWEDFIDSRNKNSNINNSKSNSNSSLDNYKTKDSSLNNFNSENSLNLNNLNINNKLDKNNIIYEDEYLLILNKNAWINVHPGDHKTAWWKQISSRRD